MDKKISLKVPLLRTDAIPVWSALLPLLIAFCTASRPAYACADVGRAFMILGGVAIIPVALVAVFMGPLKKLLFRLGLALQSVILSIPATFICWGIIIDSHGKNGTAVDIMLTAVPPLLGILWVYLAGAPEGSRRYQSFRFIREALASVACVLAFTSIVAGILPLFRA